MTATLLAEIPLPQLPSASGVELIGSVAYLSSDDAPFLYLLDATTLSPVAEAVLFASIEFETGRIPKASKPDLESMVAVVSPDGAACLLLCGSGALPSREAGYFVGLPAPMALPDGATPRFVQRLDLRPLYAHLRTHLPPDAALNLEAAAATEHALWLLQRPVGSGPALAFELPLAATLAHLFEPHTPVPAPVGLPLPVYTSARGLRSRLLRSHVSRRSPPGHGLRGGDH